MMDLLKKVALLFNNDQFHESMNLVNQILQTEKLAPEKERECLSYKVRINKMLNKADDPSLYCLAIKELELKKFNSAKKKLEEILKNNLFENKLKVYYSLWEACFKEGELFEAFSYGEKYLQELYELKRYQQMIDFLNGLIGFREGKKTVEEYFLRAVVGLGDLDLLDKEIFPDELDNYISLKSSKKYLYDLFLKLTNDDRSYWKRSRAFYEVKILSYLENIKLEDHHAQFINNVFDRLIYDPEEVNWYLLLIKYAQRFNKKKLGLTVIETLKENKDFFEIKRGLLKKMIKNESFLNLLEDIAERKHEGNDIIKDEVDLGSDLFIEYVKKDKVYEKIKRLERDINFVKLSGSDEVLNGLYDELKLLDRGNELLKKSNEQKNLDSGSRIKVKKKNANEIEAELLREIGQYVSLNKKDLIKVDQQEKEGLIRGGKKYVDMMERNELEKGLEDYVMAFYWMDLGDVCLHILDKYLSFFEKISVDEMVRIYYLKAEVLISLEKYHEAFDLCEYILFYEPLVDKEKVSFMYFLGEVSLKMKRKKRALEAFSWIVERFPKYRLSKLRLREIAKS